MTEVHEDHKIVRKWIASRCAFLFPGPFWAVKGHADQQREIECPVCEGCCSDCSGYYVSWVASVVIQWRLATSFKKKNIGSSHDKKLDRFAMKQKIAMIGRLCNPTDITKKHSPLQGGVGGVGSVSAGEGGISNCDSSGDLSFSAAWAWWFQNQKHLFKKHISLWIKSWPYK